ALHHELAIALVVGPGHVKAVFVEDLPGQAGQAAAGYEAAGQGDARRRAHRRTGAVDEHGPIADLVMAVHLEEDRVEPGFRQVIIEPALDQLDEGCLDLGPAVGIENVLAGRIGRQAVTGLKYAFVIEVDPRRRSFLYLGPRSEE